MREPGVGRGGGGGEDGLGQGGGNNRFVPQNINHKIRATENKIELLICGVGRLIYGH